MKGIGTAFILIGMIGVLLIVLKLPFSLPIADDVGLGLLITSFILVSIGSIMIMLSKEEAAKIKYLPLATGIIIFFSMFGYNRFDFTISILFVAILFGISALWAVLEYRGKRKNIHKS